MLEFGLATHGMVSGKDRALYEQVEATADLVQFAAGLGTLDAVRAQHHWLSYPRSGSSRCCSWRASRQCRATCA
jgi:hypothetical protein